MRLGTNSMGTLGNKRATGMIGFSVFDADGGVRFCVLGVGSCVRTVRRSRGVLSVDGHLGFFCGEDWLMFVTQTKSRCSVWL